MKKKVKVANSVQLWAHNAYFPWLYMSTNSVICDLTNLKQRVLFSIIYIIIYIPIKKLAVDADFP